MSNLLHRKIKTSFVKCRTCHKPMGLHKESYDTETEELWICERCGAEKWVKKNSVEEK